MDLLNAISLNNINLKINCSFKKCTNSSFFYCIDNNLYLCEECKNLFGDQNTITIDEYKSISKFIKYEKLLKSAFSNDEVDIYNKAMDLKNKFIFLNNENKLTFGDKWYNCGIGGNDPFIAVSFIGNSGSGKSSTIGSLCFQDSNEPHLNHPIPSTTDSNSTSSDINSYIGSTDSNGTLKYLILDTEGLGGTLKPSTLADGDEIHIEKRFKTVQIIYPRLLYTISDVIVYTFSGGPSEKHSIINSLCSICLVSSCITNLNSTPHLIILFNKQSNDHIISDINGATEDFFKSCDKKQTKLINETYKSISVIYLPNLNEKNSISTYNNQINQLKQLISSRIQQSIENKETKEINTSMEYCKKNITKLVDNWNENPDGKLDLEGIGVTGSNRNKIAQSISLDINNIVYNGTINYVPPSFQNNLITKKIMERLSSNYMVYFNVCYNKFLEKKISKHESFDNSINILKNGLYSSYKKLIVRNNITQINSKDFYEQFVPVLKNLSQRLLELIPCGKKIEGKYDCINSKKSHNSHQSNETYEVNKGFFKQIILKPYNEVGNYYPKKEPENFETYLTNLLQTNEDINEEEPDISLKNCLQICIGCLLDPPLLQLTCEHVLCLKCCIENEDKCVINGCKGEFINKKDIDFVPSMGCRILTLDGGGIRGIAECVALSIIREELYNIQINQLFDLIVGTSTGGIIALANVATEYSPTDIIKTFEEMATTVFSSSITSLLPFTILKMSKYNGDNLKECLTKILKDTKLCDTFHNTRVAITSVTEQRNECLFLNYFKGVSLEDQHRYIVDATCVEAALATSAAPTYFPPFSYKNRLYYDGGLKNNNPCKVALNEHKSLWPRKKIDLFLSIGTGRFKKKKSMDFFIKSNILRIANLIIDILTECEKSWEDINKKEYMHDDEKDIIIENFNSFRTNPLFKNEIGLDQCDKSTIKKLKNCYNSKHCSSNDLNLPIKKLLSSLFYVTDLEWNDNTKELSGNIKFRLRKMPSQLVSQLNGNKHHFHYYKNGKKVDITKTDDIPLNGEFDKIPFIIENPILSENIDILCSLETKSGYSKHTSISGCPFSLIECFNLYNIKLKHNIKSNTTK